MLRIISPFCSEAVGFERSENLAQILRAAKGDCRQAPRFVAGLQAKRLVNYFKLAGINREEGWLAKEGAEQCEQRLWCRVVGEPESLRVSQAEL